ncbi:MAG: nickel/cobalt transporter [Hyphomicrobiaceae bacterium]|nr:nickel/cobalt transporter [Hyphomicrobiaceae bacterium]
MGTNRRFPTLAVLALLGVGLWLAGFDAGEALAQTRSPFGVGMPEAPPASGGGLFGWIAAQQREFYRALTGAIRAIHEDGWAVATLVGLSFGYGVFHAAGPGHGKAVISAYVLANGETLRRGILLSFASAFFQASVAVAIVAVAAGVFRATAMAMTQVAQTIEIASFALIVVLGLFLVWTRVLRRGRVFTPASAEHRHDHDDHHHHDHGQDCGCGHSHAPDPRLVAGPFDWRRGVAAVVAAGLRPCSGAIIVLVFALSQGLFVAGIAAAYAMGLGTGITVAVLAALTVSGSGLAERLAGGGSVWAPRVHRAIEVGGALLVLLLGVVLLGGAMFGATGGG